MTLAKTTIKGVELVHAGEWNGMTGKAEISAEDLADAVLAYNDPETDRPVIKIGHDGDLNLATGHPAAGWVENLRLSDNKRTLIGDLTSIPTKLASIIPTAYRRRSIEMSKGVTTPSGKTYLAALTGLALLGAKAPAVKGLADVLDIYASETETPTPGNATAAERVAVTVEGDTFPVPHGREKLGEGEKDVPNPDERNAPVAFSDEFVPTLKTLLDLPADASDEDVEAKLAKVESVTLKAEPGTPAADAPKTENLGASDGDTVTVSKVVFAEMQADLSTLKTESAATRHKNALDDAVKTGRISPAERPKFAAMLAAAEAPTMTLLSELAPRYNVSIELGGAGNPDADADAELKAMLAEADAAGL